MTSSKKKDRRQKKGKIKKRSKKQKDKKHSKGASKSKACCAKKSAKRTVKTPVTKSEKQSAKPVQPPPQSPVLAEPPKPFEQPKPVGLPKPEQRSPLPMPPTQPSKEVKEKTMPQDVAPAPSGVATATGTEETKPAGTGIAHTVAGHEPTQELCISQYIKGGHEYSRWTYVTMFPVGEKPEYIYMPKIRCALTPSTPNVTSTPKTAAPSVITPDEETKQQVASKGLPSYIIKQLSTCENALKRARANLENLKILAGKDTQADLQKFDKDTKALLEELNSLNQGILNTKQANVEGTVNP